MNFFPVSSSQLTRGASLKEGWQPHQVWCEHAQSHSEPSQPMAQSLVLSLPSPVSALQLGIQEAWFFGTAFFSLVMHHDWATLFSMCRVRKKREMCVLYFRFVLKVALLVCRWILFFFSQTVRSSQPQQIHVRVEPAPNDYLGVTIVMLVMCFILGNWPGFVCLFPALIFSLIVSWDVAIVFCVSLLM